MVISRLDLGDTAHGAYSQLEEGWTAICLEGAPPGEHNKVKGDYQYLPFADAVFEEAYGGCFLEEMDELPLAFKELYRVLRVGGYAKLSSCGVYGTYYDFMRWLDLVRAEAEDAGFVFDKPVWFAEDGEWRIGYVNVFKE